VVRLFGVAAITTVATNATVLDALSMAAAAHCRIRRAAIGVSHQCAVMSKQTYPPPAAAIWTMASGDIVPTISRRTLCCRAVAASCIRDSGDNVEMRTFPPAARIRVMLSGLSMRYLPVCFRTRGHCTAKRGIRRKATRRSPARPRGAFVWRGVNMACGVARASGAR
jgi:hypothetical protein